MCGREAQLQHLLPLGCPKDPCDYINSKGMRASEGGEVIGGEV